MASKKNILVCFTPDQFEKYADGKSTVVIVDLLRATSVISTAFENGINAVIPVQTLEKALEYKNKEGYILAAERNTKPVEGFAYGNSPYHYINSGIKGKTLVLRDPFHPHIRKIHKMETPMSESKPSKAMVENGRGTQAITQSVILLRSRGIRSSTKYR